MGSRFLLQGIFPTQGWNTAGRFFTDCTTRKAPGHSPIYTFNRLFSCCVDDELKESRIRSRNTSWIEIKVLRKFQLIWNRWEVTETGCMLGLGLT